MAEEIPQSEAEPEKVDAEFINVSSEVRRLEKGALPKGARAFPPGAFLAEFDVEKISIESYEAALESARGIENKGVRGRGTPKEEKVEERILTEEELQRIPTEKIEVVARGEKEIIDEERKLKEMKNKFARLISELPKDEQKDKMVLEEAAVRAEEKPADEGKAEEIKELSENFKKIMMKKEEREKQERVRKMKKEIEDMLDSG